MATISLDTDYSEFQKFGRRYPDQVDFAASLAINMTLRDIQKAMRARLRQIFIIRRPRFADLSVKITKKSNKRDLPGIIEIESPGQAPDVFGKFEIGGRKEAFEGVHVAVPQEIRKDITRVIPRRQHPRNLRKTFVVNTARGKQLLIQRKGRGRRADTVVQYTLHESVRIPAILGFEILSKRVFSQSFPGNFESAAARAIRTRR